VKIKGIILFSVVCASSKAMAFQDKNATIPAPSQQQLSSVESNLINHFALANNKALPVNLCEATPVAGCNCPFCTMLRSQA